jgi:hypothetical protein
MTNAESLLKSAVAILDQGQLSGESKDFVERIRHYDKKRLKKLSSAQYEWLRNIVADHPS